MTNIQDKMYYLTSFDVLEYLLKQNSEKILLENCVKQNSSLNTQLFENNININFLKKHLFYDLSRAFRCIYKFRHLRRQHDN